MLRKTFGTERKRFLSNDNKKNSWSLLFQDKIFYSKFVSSFTIVRVKSTISSLSSCPLFQDSFTNLMVVSSSLFYELNLLFLVFFQVHCTQNLLFQGCFKFTILEWNPLYFMLMGFFKHDMLKIVSPYEFHVWFLWPPWISLTCLFNVLKSAISRGF